MRPGQRSHRFGHITFETIAPGNLSINARWRRLKFDPFHPEREVKPMARKKTEKKSGAKGKGQGPRGLAGRILDQIRKEIKECAGELTPSHYYAKQGKLMDGGYAKSSYIKSDPRPRAAQANGGPQVKLDLNINAKLGAPRSKRPSK